MLTVTMIRPDRVYRTGVIEPLPPNYQPGSAYQQVAQAFVNYNQPYVDSPLRHMTAEQQQRALLVRQAEAAPPEAGARVVVTRSSGAPSSCPACSCPSISPSITPAVVQAAKNGNGAAIAVVRQAIEAVKNGNGGAPAAASCPPGQIFNRVTGFCVPIDRGLAPSDKPKCVRRVNAASAPIGTLICEDIPGWLEANGYPPAPTPAPVRAANTLANKIIASGSAPRAGVQVAIVAAKQKVNSLMRGW